MNNQNILKFFGSKLDVKLDSSEYYDYEIAKNEYDYDTDVLDLTTPIIYDSQIIDSSCLIGFTTPWNIPINKKYIINNCDFTVRRRTEQGWTLNFVFNRKNLPWISGQTFYYLGIIDETAEENYLDNNLSFSFTSDGRIKWESVRYSGYCDSLSGYTDTSYISSGQTIVLCSGGTSDDFNITITFKRYKTLTNCDLYNLGGQNDLITGWTVTNPLGVITGDSENYTIIETLGQKWFDEKNERLGTLKIYLNGKPIYKIENWEETIPSQRNSENSLLQIWGGGTTGSGNIHNGNTEFNVKKVQYFEEPLNFIRLRHFYLIKIKPFFNINDCSVPCIDNLFGFTTPTLTPTLTPTPTPTPIPLYYAYLFIEPTSGIRNLSTYMLNQGHNWGGFNLSSPSVIQSIFENQMISYINYSGWTSGLLPNIRTQLIPQTSGGLDSFGNPITAYNFTTHRIPANTINDTCWFTWIIPVIGINNLKQTEIGFNYGNIPTNLTSADMNSTIYNLTINYSGSTIPNGIYRVYTTKPSTIFRTNNINDIYFKGIQVQ